MSVIIGNGIAVLLVTGLVMLSVRELLTEHKNGGCSGCASCGKCAACGGCISCSGCASCGGCSKHTNA